MQNLHIISLCGCDCILCAVTNETEDGDDAKEIIIHRFSSFLFGRVQRTDLHVTLRGMYIPLYSNL